MSGRVDVAVIGAGIAGGSAAKALADRGWETLLIDKGRFPRHKVCGEFLSPESRSALASLGLTETLAQLRPSPITRARLVPDRGEALEIALPGQAFGVSRYALDAALRQAASASGARLVANTCVTNVTPERGGFAIETRQGTTYRARAVIAAWGANRRAGLPGRAASAGSAHFGVKTHLRGVGLGPVVELYFFPGGYLGLAPVEDGLVNAAALLSRQAFAHAEPSVAGLIAAAARRHPQLREKLAGAVPVPGSQAAVAPVRFSRRPAAWDVVPRVGDAAVMLPPLCGDGMSMALRSAERCALLADGCLRGRLSLSRWEQEYVRAIRREFAGPLRWGRLAQAMLASPASFRLLLGLGHLAPGLARGLMRATRLKEADG